jgi:hypothetical protein
VFFSAVIVHGTALANFLPSAIVPIPKGRNANLSVSEFCGMALSSACGKIFDNMTLERYHQHLASSELLFSFKRKSSTNLCTMVLKKTLSYDAIHPTPVFCNLLDASKAFYRICYCKLSELLIKRKLPAFIIIVLINLYTNNFLRVIGGGVMTDYFSAVR